MKRIFTASTLLVLFALLVWSGCKTAKVTTPNYIGKWNYVMSIPDGDFPGFLEFSQEGELVRGIIGSDMGSMDLNDLKIDENTVSANFDFQGNTVDLSGDFEGDVLKAVLSVQGYEIPIEAKKAQQ